MGISSPGIGSNLDINGIVAKLMQAESLPLQALAKKEASYQAKLSAFGNLSGALGAFQNALGALNNQSTFKTMTATPSDTSIFSASAGTQAAAGSYNINVTQLAQSQALTSGGRTSTSATIGNGATTTLTFQFGTIGGNIATAGSKLSAAVAASGIAPNSLSINGTTITTGSSTTSASALANQINLASATTGVTATAQTTDSGLLGSFTAMSGPYRLDIGGVNVINETSTTATVDGTAIDTALSSAAGSLAAAGISYSGTAAGGDLRFTRADGSNITAQESGTGPGGFTTSLGLGTTKTFTSSVSLSSANTITIGGTGPAAAGFGAGSFSTYGGGATFTQDVNQAIGTVTIDNTNNSLQGIRDAINKANIGVTASIVSDGSASPYHLVVKSNKTGVTSSMKIDVQSTDPTNTALSDLLAYNPAGVQNMSQSSAAQNTSLTVNGITVTSADNNINGAVEGVSLTVSKVGTASLNIARNTGAVQSSVTAFVKAYNDLNSMIKKLTSYDATTKQAGVLLGDSSVRTIEGQLRKMLTSPTTGSNSSLSTLGQVGISIDKSGVMSLDSGKLSTAMNNNMTDVAALFSSVGTTTDSLVSFVSASSESAPGNQPVFVSRLATQGKVAGALATPLTAAPTTIGSANKDFTMTIDGVTASVSLAQGTYSAAELATQVQSAINGTSAFSSAGIAVNVSIDASGQMNIASNKYGSDSKVSVTGATDLLGSSPVVTDGLDVAGTIGGVAATGSGQYLTGASGSPAAGLKLQITGGAENASRGSVTFSQGYAFHLNNLLSDFLGSAGLISGRKDGLNSTIQDIGRQNTVLNDRLADIEKRYRAQFTALDVTISKMTSTSTYLTQQLAQISNLSKQ